MLEANRVIGNMVLFKCNVCNCRFPTFHPSFKPPYELQCLKHTPILVDDANWDVRPQERSTLATFHTGICQRCMKEKENVEKHPEYMGVELWSAQNQMGPLFGIDEVAVRKEYKYLFENATAVEAMLVALNHMQVDVCYVQGHREARGHITTFRKNIILFHST